MTPGAVTQGQFYLGEETVPLRDGRDGVSEVTTVDDDRPAPLPGGTVEGQSFLGEETVPLRDDGERREAEERDARLRLILPRRRRWRW